MYLIERLGQLPVRDGIFSGTLGDPSNKEKLDRFLDKVRARPQDYKDLLLNAHLHPFPQFSRAITNYLVGKTQLIDLIMLAAASDELIRKDLYNIADAKLQQEIKAERKLGEKMLEALKKADKSKLKLTRWFVQAALLDPKKVENPDGDVGYVWFEFPEIGSNFAKKFLGSVGKEIFNSKASNVHLVKLGLGLARHAINLLEKDSAFKKEVEKERKKQARAEEERKRKERRRGRK